jgi:hypothetical protein
MALKGLKQWQIHRKGNITLSTPVTIILQQQQQVI